MTDIKRRDLLAKDKECWVAGGTVAGQTQHLVFTPPVRDHFDEQEDDESDVGI